MIKKLALIPFCAFLAFVWFPATPSTTSAAQGLAPVTYDIVYVRSPRPGDNTNTFWSDAITPLLLDAGADLMLLRPNGSEEILFDASANGAVTDPYVSYDARSVVFAYFPNVRNVNPQRGLNSTYALSYDGADIYRVEIATRAVTRLTFQEFTPNTGNGADFDCSRSQTNCPNVGVFNTGPAFLPDGRIVFTSTRDNLVPNKTTHGGQRALQLYVMDGDGQNVQPIGFLNVSSAMHPFVLKDGRIVFTSWENQGARDDRVFPLWAIWADGTRFEPFSGFGDGPFAHHFMTQISDGSIVVCRYYNLNNNGFGELYRFPINGSGVPNSPLFQPIPPDSASADEIPLKRVGYMRITPFTTADDFPSPCRVGDQPYPPVPCQGGNNTRVGKFTMPSSALNNEMLVVYTRGSANHNGIYVGAGLTAPYYDGGIYRMRGDQVLGRPEDLVLVKNDPNYNEMWPRAVVPYQQIYGVQAPANLPELANDGQLDARLPEGTPLALIGTSSMISRDTRPFKGDRFYQHENFGDRNWTRQGADAGLYMDDDIYAVRILALQPITDRSYPNNGRAFDSHFSERVRILGEIPVRKEGVIDAQGNVDTSFLAKIPADVPFTFQTLDRNGLVLNTAQTWHQARPGERRMDCGGCHAHSKPALDFSTTAASLANYVVRDLATTTPLLAVDGSPAPGVTTSNARSLTVEYLRDIKPIFQAKCASCHTSRNGQTPAAGLDLDADHRLVNGYPATYAWLARSRSASNPTPRSVTPGGDWYWPQVTRYIRAGQSRQSLLVWKVFGRRLDGRANADRPTETVPGNPSTIPNGAQWQECDLDFTGGQMPPASSASLTWEERMKIARWVDLGAPIDLTGIIQQQGGGGFAGFLEDDIRPTLSLVPTVSRAQVAGSLSRFVIGAYDLDSGIDPATLTLSLNRAVGSIPAGTNLATGLTITEGGTVIINLATPINLASGSVTATVQIRDRAGHVTRLVRTYKTGASCGSLSSSNQLFSPAGGSGSVNVSAPANCHWTATSNVPWVVITSAGSGVGNGTVSFTISANSASVVREGTLSIAGQVFTVSQRAGSLSNCSFSISLPTGKFKGRGGTGNIGVTTTAECAWQASSDVNWITFTSGSAATGSGEVNFTVALNPAPIKRKGRITIGGQTLVITQKPG